MGLTRQRRGCRGKRAWSEKRRKEWRRERRGGWRVEWTAEGARQREGNGTQKSMKDGETGVKTAMGGRGGNGEGERGEKDEWEEKRQLGWKVRAEGQQGEEEEKRVLMQDVKGVGRKGCEGCEEEDGWGSYVRMCGAVAKRRFEERWGRVRSSAEIDRIWCPCREKEGREGGKGRSEGGWNSELASNGV